MSGAGGLLVVEYLPKHPEVLGVQLFLRRDGFHLAGGEGGSVTDSGEQVRLNDEVALAGNEIGVILPQPGGTFVGPVATSFRGREAEAIGKQDRVIRDLFCGIQVAREQGRGNFGERLGRVGESFPGGAIRGKLARRSQIDVRQIANGGVVFGVAEPPQRNMAGVASPCPGLGIEKTLWTQARSFFFSVAVG